MANPSGVVSALLILFVSVLNIQFVKSRCEINPTSESGALLFSSPYTIVEENSGTCKVAVMVGEVLTYKIPLLQVQRLLEHQGLIYDVIRDADLSPKRFEQYSAIIVIGASQPTLISQDDFRRGLDEGTGLIWIGEALPDSLYPLFGIRKSSMDEDELQNITRIDYGTTSTRVYNETICAVEASEASVQGFFVDDVNHRIAPAETSYRRNSTSGLAHYFAYDVCSWWGADLDVPWLRAYRLQLALENVLFEHLTVRLAPYPRNLRSVFICRVEDVDPLHNSAEWLARANKYLDYYSMKNAPLTVSLIPTYLDPSAGLKVGIEADSAVTLRGWLSDVVLRGGTLIEHGFTHQYGREKTGVFPEFFDAERGEWLPLEEQIERISHGASQIYSSLGFTVEGFEAPHYLANHDTYIALNKLGFKYVTHNNDTPFFDRYGLSEGLINIPETLGFIPLDSSNDAEARIIFNMNMLYNMSGVMLFFNHLFDEEALQVGEHILDHALSMRSVWYTNTDNLADFWHQRLNAYGKMSVEVSSKIKVTLGSSNRAGLTLVLNKWIKIKSVIINGTPWPVFNENYVILPVLPENSNTVIIDLTGAEENSNMHYGLFMTMLSVILSPFLYRAIKRNSRHSI